MFQRVWMNYLKNGTYDQPNRTPTVFAMSFRGVGHQMGSLGVLDIITEDGEALLFEDGIRISEE